MSERVFLRAAAFALLSLTALCGPPLTARARQGADVEGLIKQLEDKDERTVMKAAQALMRLGPGAVAPLAEGMKTRKGCQFQYVASGIIYAIDHDKARANPVLEDVMLGRCRGSSERDLKLRRMAAFALVVRADGIPLVARMLSDKETFNRRTAAFAFDELTEKLQGARPDSIEVTPEIQRAFKEALPALVRALGDRDEVVRCMSYEAVGQAQGSRSEELRSEAARLARGVKVDCSK
jgi:HEAT repeat protein